MPNVVDNILEGLVNAVVNTVSGGREPMKDSFQIRRAAVERRIPCYTLFWTRPGLPWRP